MKLFISFDLMIFLLFSSDEILMFLVKFGLCKKRLAFYLSLSWWLCFSRVFLLLGTGIFFGCDFVLVVCN